jgi:hypothetical protein
VGKLRSSMILTSSNADNKKIKSIEDLHLTLETASETTTRAVTGSISIIYNTHFRKIIMIGDGLI